MTARGDDKVSKLEPVPSGPAPSADTLGAKVARERARAFVGREAELALFREMFEPDPPCRLLIIHGPGGVGKTSVLEAFHREANRASVPVVRLDARNLPEDQAAIERYFNRVVGDAALDSGRAAVLLVDGFEVLAAVEGWFREALLADLPGNIRVVLAMRRRPDPAWTLDAGWARLTRVHELAALSREASGRLLADMGAPAERFDELYRLTGGHPLALTLAASLLRSEPGLSLSLADTPELVRRLSASHLADAPSDQARSALFACGIARNLDLPLLEAMLDASGGLVDVFAWLRQQSFVHETASGLHAHALVGEALAAELRRRDPALHRRMIRNGSRHLFDRSMTDRYETAIEDALFLMRGVPPVRKAFAVSRDTGFSVDRVRDGDGPDLAGLVERAWGSDSRRWFETWLAHAPGWLTVLRDSARRPVGMTFYLDLAELPEDLVQADPAVRAFRDYLAEYAPLRPGERAMVSRFLVAGDGEGDPGPGISQLQCHNAFMPLKVPELAFTATVRPDTRDNRMQAHYAGIRPLGDTEFELDGREFFIMGHDWRLEPPLDWLYDVTDRLISGTETASAAGLVLDERAFADALKDALRAMAAGGGLDDNPLMGTALIRSAATKPGNGESPVEALRTLIRQAAERLVEQPRGDELAAVIRHTYLEPAPKQRAAAAESGLSYGTYRRRLREAVREISSRLWKEELEASRAASLAGEPQGQR